MGIRDIEALKPDDEPSTTTVEAPTKPGWYAYSGGAQTMIFLLRDKLVTFSHRSEAVYKKQWMVILDNGEVTDCEWGYIEQCLGVWDLVYLSDLISRVENV